MYLTQRWFLFAIILGSMLSSRAAPMIDPIANASVPAGKSIIIPVTGSSLNGRPLTYTAMSSTNRIAVEVHSNNPFWKMSVMQIAPANAPGAFQTPFRGGLATVTNIGDMTFMLFRERATRTVDAVSALTLAGFYNSNTIFHRVIPGFMIQGGDPATNGMGGPVFRYDDEFHPRTLFAGSGQLALANSGKDTDGSQFFVTLGPQRFLDLGYTLFGQLLRGFNVVSNVINTPRNASDRPLADVIIARASLVSNAFDTVLTLTGTNLVGVAGTILVIADDSVGGRTTNTFTATTVSDSANNAPPMLYPATVTNLVAPLNGRLTNFITVLDLESNTPVWDVGFLDQASFLNASNSTFTTSNGRLVIIPNVGYSGSLGLFSDVSRDASFSTYDHQVYTFAIGDTVISAVGTNFVTLPLGPFTNQILASFTNGVANSTASNFTAFINWGDNSANSGTILTNTNGRKEVRGSHTYTNSGEYPVYISIQSRLGANATVISTAVVPPSLSLTRIGTNNIIRWPAWAASYELQSRTNLGPAQWTSLTDLAALAGYDNVATNGSKDSNLFFRLRR